MKSHPEGLPVCPDSGVRRHLLRMALISAIVLVFISPIPACRADAPQATPMVAAKPSQHPVNGPPALPLRPCKWPPKLQNAVKQALKFSDEAGSADAVLLTDPDGCRLVAIQADVPLIPASTLKLLTAAAALHYLGPDHRFQTDFFKAPAGHLKVKGYGDPLLISEVLADLSRSLAGHLSVYGDLVVDDTWFEQPLFIPGRSTSLQPYDAPNGALCVNFNTVFFKRRNGRVVSAEPQTPLLPFAREKIAASGEAKGRIGLSAGAAENIRYSGELIQYFLGQAGVRSQGRIRSGLVMPDDKRIYRHQSPYALTEVVAKLMAFSNNFMANQLFISTGIAVEGPPGTLSKAQAAVHRYARETLGLRQLKLVEGSGISRRNRMSAADLLQVLDAMAPFYHLLKQDGREYYKTGTLDGIRTRAGYLEGTNGKLYRFVVLRNTPGATTDSVMGIFKHYLP